MFSLSASVPFSQLRWHSSLTRSIPDFESYPKRFLSSEEKAFVLWLQSFKVGAYYRLVTASELASKIKELWSWLLPAVRVTTLQKHLVRLSATSPRHNKSYLNREYQLSNRTIGLWLFRKGLIRGYAVPKKGVRQIVLYGYPVTHYPLTQKNYVSPFPPHNYFASLCTVALQTGLGSGVLRKVDPSRYRIPHWDDSGYYVADNCYWFNFHGKEEYLWQEVHTGSEGFDSRIFIKRLLTMEHQLIANWKGYYVVFVPFVRDVAKAQKAITNYNRKSPEKPLFLTRCFIVPYTHIPLFKERLGIYHHQK